MGRDLEHQFDHEDGEAPLVHTLQQGPGNPPGFYIISAEISRVPLDGTGLRAVYSAYSSGNWG